MLLACLKIDVHKRVWFGGDKNNRPLNSKLATSIQAVGLVGSVGLGLWVSLRIQDVSKTILEDQDRDPDCHWPKMDNIFEAKAK